MCQLNECSSAIVRRSEHWTMRWVEEKNKLFECLKLSIWVQKDLHLVITASQNNLVFSPVILFMFFLFNISTLFCHFLKLVNLEDGKVFCTYFVLDDKPMFYFEAVIFLTSEVRFYRLKWSVLRKNLDFWQSFPGSRHHFCNIVTLRCVCELCFEGRYFRVECRQHNNGNVCQIYEKMWSKGKGWVINRQGPKTGPWGTPRL